MPDENAETPTRPVAGARLWLSPRRKRFWLLAALFAYTLAGFYLVPAVLERQIVAQLERNFDRAASVDRVEFNPYALSLRVAGLSLQDEDGSRLAGFDELFVNFQLSSLFRWALTFRELRLAGPYFHFERFADGSSRLDRLLAAFEANNPPDPDAADATGEGLPRLLLQDLQILDGHVDVTDRVPAGGVQTVVGRNAQVLDGESEIVDSDLDALAGFLDAVIECEAHVRIDLSDRKEFAQIRVKALRTAASAGDSPLGAQRR